MTKYIQLSRLLFLCCLIIMFNSCSSYDNHQRTSRFYFDLSIPNGISPIVHEENWSFTGEGRIYIEYEFDSEAFNQFLANNDFTEYSPLPIDKPIQFSVPHEISNYMSPNLYNKMYCDSLMYRFNNNSGLYNENDVSRGCNSIVVLDMEACKMYLYYYHD